MRIAIFGGYGFIGGNLIQSLMKNPPWLDSGEADTLEVAFYGTDKQISGKISSLLKPGEDKITFVSFAPYPYPQLQESLQRILAGKDLVINLVGILNEHNPANLRDLGIRALGQGYVAKGKQARADYAKLKSFAFAHTQLPQALAEACAKNGARLLHLSAQNADPSSRCRYLASKGRGEQAIQATAKLDWTIVRPGLVLGKDAGFVLQMRRLAKIMPLMFLPLANSYAQPVCIDDLIKLLREVIKQPQKYKQRVLNAAGVEVLSFAELVRLCGGAKIIPLPSVFNLPMALAAESVMRSPVITRDNIRATQCFQPVTENHIEGILGGKLSDPRKIFAGS